MSAEEDRRRAVSRSWSIAASLLAVCDHGAGTPFTLDETVERVRHPMSFVKGKDQLLEVVAFLACQSVGYAHSQNADAELAMTQITRTVRDYEAARHARPNATGLPEYSDLDQETSL